jgi:hypothetical protein
VKEWGGYASSRMDGQVSGTLKKQTTGAFKFGFPIPSWETMPVSTLAVSKKTRFGTTPTIGICAGNFFRRAE